MSEGEKTDSQIRMFILQRFPQARKRGLQPDLMLLESGIIDSLGVLDVVTFMEETFSVKIVDEELTPENFGTLQRMVSFVDQKRTRLTAPAF